jgi:aspartokinase-like uncharacterized kinase
MSQPLRVVKVGGSLFSRSDLADRLTAWLDVQSPATHVLLAGGGELAEVVREWDQRLALGQERSHWMCVDLLDVTARLLHKLVPQSQWCDDWRKLRSIEPTTVVFAPARFLRTEEPGLPGDRLPCSWGATSDSIAARLAEVCNAAELVLLKSADPPPYATLADIAGTYVDDHFPRAAASVKRLRLVNLCHGQ